MNRFRQFVAWAGTLRAILTSLGAGKTTLLRVIIRFLEPDVGAVTIGGLAVAVAWPQVLGSSKRAVGYVASERALYRWSPHDQGEALPMGRKVAVLREGMSSIPRSSVGAGDDQARANHPWPSFDRRGQTDFRPALNSGEAGLVRGTVSEACSRSVAAGLVWFASGLVNDLVGEYPYTRAPAPEGVILDERSRNVRGAEAIRDRDHRGIVELEDVRRGV